MAITAATLQSPETWLLPSSSRCMAGMVQFNLVDWWLVLLLLLVIGQRG